MVPVKEVTSTNPPLRAYTRSSATHWLLAQRPQIRKAHHMQKNAEPFTSHFLLLQAGAERLRFNLRTPRTKSARGKPKTVANSHPETFAYKSSRGVQSTVSAVSIPCTFSARAAACRTRNSCPDHGVNAILKSVLKGS